MQRMMGGGVIDHLVTDILFSFVTVEQRTYLQRWDGDLN